MVRVQVLARVTVRAWGQVPALGQALDRVRAWEPVPAKAPALARGLAQGRDPVPVAGRGLVVDRAQAWGPAQAV